MTDLPHNDAGDAECRTLNDEHGYLVQRRLACPEGHAVIEAGAYDAAAFPTIRCGECGLKLVDASMTGDGPEPELETDGGEALGECAVDSCDRDAVEILNVDAPRGSLDMPACSSHATSSSEADASGGGDDDEHSDDDSASSTDVDVDVVEHA